LTLSCSHHVTRDLRRLITGKPDPAIFIALPYNSTQGADVRHALRDWNSVPVLVEGKDGGFATSGEFLCHV
jgi:hypothetical protein